MVDNTDPLDDIKDISEYFTPERRAIHTKMREKLRILKSNIDKMERAGFDVAEMKEQYVQMTKEFEKLDRLATQ